MYLRCRVRFFITQCWENYEEVVPKKMKNRPFYGAKFVWKVKSGEDIKRLRRNLIQFKVEMWRLGDENSADYSANLSAEKLIKVMVKLV